MTDQEYKQLAQLVTYLLESEDWTCVWLNEYAEPIRLFMFKTGMAYRTVHKYVKDSLQKLLGPVFKATQQRLANKCCGEDDLFFKPKSLTQKRKEEQLKNAKPKNKIIKNHTPNTEFGKKYKEHYGGMAIENRAQYVREKRFYKEMGRCSWEK